MPLTDYLTAPRRTAGFRQGLGPVRTPGGELRQWAHQVVEKVRVASVGGRLRFLPWYDPYTDETPEIRATYRIMLVDDAVKSAFLMKVLSVISQGVQFQPADDDNPRDRAVAQFCTYAFGKAKGGTPGLGWSVVAHGLIDGHSVCEPVWDDDTIPYGVWRGKRIFRAVKAKDTRYLQLGIDPYRNVTAIRGTGFNAGRVWSPSDFAIFSHLPLFENPAGMSDFRAAYQPFWMKRTVWNLRALHLENYTGPFIKGEYANVEQKAALEEALQEAKSSTWLTVPHGALIECIDLSMKGTADFKDAIDDCNKAILVAIAGAHLQIMEGQVPGGRGNTKVQQGTAELAQWWLSESLATVYREQLVPTLVAENFHGVDTPQVSLGAVTEEAMLEMLKVDEGLQRIGALLAKADVYKRYGRQQPVEADDILQPPGQGGGTVGAPPSPPGSAASLGPEGGDGGSPNASFAEGDVHGPRSPGPGWVQVGTGPRGGKVWRREGDKAPAAPAAAAAPARPVSAEQAAAVKDAFEEMSLYGEVRRDGIMRVDQARSVFNQKTGLDLSGPEFAGFLEDAHKAHALRLQIENHVNDAAKEPGYAATMPHFGDVAYGYVEPPRTEAGMERLAAFAREYAAGARQVRAGNTLAAEVARAGKHAEGGDGGSSPFAEHRAFCQEGPNKGKPGPCPEGGTDSSSPAPAPGKARAGKARVGIFRAWLKSRGWTRGLSPVQKEASRRYVDNSAPVNKPLWQHPDDWRESLTGKALEDATALHDALDKAPTFALPVTVWRGVQLFDREPAFLDACKEALAAGHGLQMAGFLSTTFDAEIAENFSANVVLEIAARKGAYLSGVGGKEAGQSELLMQHNSVFTVAGIETATVAGQARTVVRLTHRPGAEAGARVVRDVAGIAGTKVVHAEAGAAEDSRFAVTSLEGVRLVEFDRTSESRTGG